jgi:hypothetical protein
MNTYYRHCHMIAIGVVALSAFAPTAGAQSGACLGSEPSIAMLNSVRAIARRLYNDVHGPRNRDSVMVVALLLDTRCRLVQHAHGTMAFPYSTRDAFEALFGWRVPRRIGLAGISPMPTQDTTEHRRVVFGIVPDTVTR